jgi:hypothetical protein
MVAHPTASMKAATPTGKRERRLHREPLQGRSKMSIEGIIAGLSAELRSRLERDAERAKHMTGGGHLQEWLDYEVSLQGIRTEAMRAAFVNEPRGRGYNEAHSQLMQHYGLDQLDKTSVSAVLWLTDPKDKYGPELFTRKQILDRILQAMKPQERSRMGSPITARQKVEKQIAEFAKSGTDEAEADVGERPLSKFKQTEQMLAKVLQEKHRLEERLKHDGSLFDLKNDKADDIVEAIVANISTPKAEAIGKGLLARIKRKLPAG